jgi:hypothetical protein
MPETTSVRRGPGRPRKVQETESVKSAPKSERPLDPDDPRIGQECDPDWSVVAFSDTDRQYRCENGVIVERVR